MLKRLQFFFVWSLLLLCTSASADIVITMHSIVNAAADKSIGTIVAKQTPYGVLFTPDLRNLPPGAHGFHVHKKPSCEESGMAAGGHYDPANKGKHRGPYNFRGHLGDLPVLIVNKDGKATIPVLAPRLRLSNLRQRSLMIHQGGDNYSDEPKKLGGGGLRIACGVIK